MLDPMPMMIETTVTRQSATKRLPPEKSIRTAENFSPRPARTMPPMMMPSVPMAAPAAALLRAPPTMAWAMAVGPMRVSRRSQDRAAAETVPQKAQKSAE